MTNRLDQSVRSETLSPRPGHNQSRDQHAAELARLDRALDEALAATFPASDPIQVP